MDLKGIKFLGLDSIHLAQYYVENWTSAKTVMKVGLE
jgi:hypothetical protein